MSVSTKGDLFGVEMTKPPARQFLTGKVQPGTAEILKSVGLRPTRQRMELASLLFGSANRHLTAETLYEEAIRANVTVSLATVYNTLNHLADAGLLQEVSVDGAKTYFDTNVRHHHHFYVESTREILDIPALDNPVLKSDAIPKDYEVSSIDIIVRLRRKPSKCAVTAFSSPQSHEGR